MPSRRSFLIGTVATGVALSMQRSAAAVGQQKASDRRFAGSPMAGKHSGPPDPGAASLDVNVALWLTEARTSQRTRGVSQSRIDHEHSE
jgi:hypothetical protein